MNLNAIIDQVGSDKGIDREILVETLKSAILTAARRTYGPQREIEADYNEETGEVELYQIITVEEEVDNPYQQVSVEEVQAAGFDAEVGDELVFQIFYRDDDRQKAREQDARFGKLLKLDSYNSTFGRIAAQTAKQVIIQRVREAERDIIYGEYQNRIGEMVTGIVRRFEKGNLIVDLGRTDAILPRREQTPREAYRPGDRIQGMIRDVQRASRSPQVVLTRADPQLLFKLFESEVPEIYDGTVRIVAVAREPGVRSKVAVYSRESNVDPVGACVGMRGSRVQAVVSELRGEKIDIVPYVEDTARFVCNAISPAEVAKVLIDEHNMTMELIVPDDQLSLAIGRGGQNVRLAAQLTGWNLDIISETRLRNMMEETRQNLLEFEGITADMIDSLFTLGYNKLEHIAQAETQELSQIPGVSTDSAQKIIVAAEEILARPKSKTPEVQTPEDRLKTKLRREVPSVNSRLADQLFSSGYRDVQDVAFIEGIDEVAKETGIASDKLQKIVEEAKEVFVKAAEIDSDEAFAELRAAHLEAGGSEGRLERGEYEGLESAAAPAESEESGELQEEAMGLSDDEGEEVSKPSTPDDDTFRVSGDHDQEDDVAADALAAEIDQSEARKPDASLSAE